MSAIPREEDNPYNLPSLLGNYDDDTIKKMLARLQLSGGLQKQKSQYTDSTYADGRVGYNFPVGQGDLTLGLSGMKAKTKVNAPNYQGTFKDAGITGIDAAYQTGDSRLAGSLNKGGNYDINYSRGEDTIGLNNDSLRKLLQLYYSRRF